MKMSIVNNDPLSQFSDWETFLNSISVFRAGMGTFDFQFL